jgi:hypothetical protein
VTKSDDKRLEALIKKNMAKAEAKKPKAKLRKQYDDTLQPEGGEGDLDTRDFFSDMKKREF